MYHRYYRWISVIIDTKENNEEERHLSSLDTNPENNVDFFQTIDMQIGLLIDFLFTSSSACEKTLIKLHRHFV